MAREVLSVAELAQILGTTPGSLRTMLYEHRDLPPSFKLGSRRVFLRRAVYDWLRCKAGASGRRRQNPSTASTKEQTMIRIAEGNTLLDLETGDELEIKKIYPQRGLAVVEDQDGDEQTVGIQTLLDGIASGTLQTEESDEDEDDDADGADETDSPEGSDEDEEE